MKTFIKAILVLFGLAFLFGVAFILWAKVPSPDASNTVNVKGIVEAVSSPCCNDIVIHIQGDNHIYYINHGVDLGIDSDGWHKLMKGEEVEVTYIITRWNPFNAQGTHRPLSGVNFMGELVFDMKRDWVEL